MELMFMKTENLMLGAVSAFLLVGGVSMALAIGPNDSPDPNSDKQMERKSGDMYVHWRGRSYRSARMTSPANRSFRGGGLHGGK
jgi:hypothetical protein